MGGETSLPHWYQMSHMIYTDPWDFHGWRTHPGNSNCWKASAPWESAPEWRCEEKTWAQHPAWFSQAWPKSAKPKAICGLMRERWMLLVTYKLLGFWDCWLCQKLTNTSSWCSISRQLGMQMLIYKQGGIWWLSTIHPVEYMIPTQRTDSLA